MAAVAVVLVVAAVTIVVGRRRALTRPPSTPELPGVVPTSPVSPATPTPAEGTEAPEVAAETAPQAPTVETPEPPSSRLARLRRRLSASNNPFARGLLGLLSADRLDAEAWEDLEATLITADLGVGPTDELITALRRELSIDGTADPAKAKDVLRSELLRLVGTDADRSLKVTGADGVPGVVLVVGVNGTGKTTTIGKLSRVLVAEGHSVVLAAADTFRAAAADQLQTWASRVGVPVVRGPEGGDPASVAFDAVEKGLADGVDVVVVDTAGRLHTKTGLMDELGKIKRVIERKAPVTEVLLVIDATTGQNGLAQARVFAEVVDVTGIVLSKLDGSAKGGIVVPVQRELGVPVKLIGLGEGPDDLAPFEPEGFVDALLAES
ncbi:MAG: signal recognition particle-docking protein FtsY [Propionicimonas sp.]|uniref:signal recognition particle-docking protein FtsY n=1 Tax=Propionicimonas sp. TaxID=1955623 RepID=UPI003D0C0569